MTITETTDDDLERDLVEDWDQAAEEATLMSLDDAQRSLLAGGVAVLREARHIVTPEALPGFDAALAVVDVWVRDGLDLDALLVAGDHIDEAREASLLAGPEVEQHIATMEVLKGVETCLMKIGVATLDGLISMVARHRTPESDTRDEECLREVRRLTLVAAVAGARLDGSVAVAVDLGGEGQPS